MVRDVHIKVHCPTEDHIQMARMVFRTVRIGFPQARIWAHAGHLPPAVMKEIEACGAKCYPVSRVGHDEWLESLLQGLADPFVVLDTDVVFHEVIEDFQHAGPMAGAFEPQHHNPVTDAVHWARLHPSVLFVNPRLIRERLRAWYCKHSGPAVPMFGYMVRQQWLPHPSGLHFADTACLLYNAIGGDPFQEPMRDRFTHLHCGSWAEVAGKSIPGLLDAHTLAIDNPKAVRGLWRKYEQFYVDHAANPGTSHFVHGSGGQSPSP